jgi:hypothetical protein
LLAKALAVVLSRMGGASYRPEKHYMRGPGPKTLEQIGAQLRAESEDITRQPLPESWLALTRSLRVEDEKPLRRPETDQQGAKASQAAELDAADISTGTYAQEEQLPPKLR